VVGRDAELNSQSNGDNFKGRHRLKKWGFDPKYWVFDPILLLYPADIRSETSADSKSGWAVCEIEGE
jgi:hypothetical protein